MDSLKDIFLKDIAKPMFPRCPRREIQYLAFIYRLDPDLHHLINREIGDKVTEEVDVDATTGFGMHLREAIKKFFRTYQDELDQDGITQEDLGIKEKSGSSGGRLPSTQDPPWVIAYRWLWEKRYSRWQQDYIWESWKQVASKHSEWIQFLNTTRGMKKSPPVKRNLPMNTPLNLKIELNCSGCYFLLFNRGLDNQGTTTKCLVIPSLDFAPSPLLEPITLIPQEDAIFENIEFDAVGKEEYIGILLDRDLDLPWLNPDPNNPTLEWQGKHLGEVWERLQKLNNWQVFYRDFEIVPKKG